MKRYLFISKVIAVVLFFAMGVVNVYGQACSSVPGTCTYTRSSVLNTSVTVNSGETLCVTSGTYTGDVTLNAGATIFVYNTATFNPTNFNINGSATINVMSGGTFNKDMSPNSAVVLNNCGTIAGSRSFNPSTATNLTINQYSSNTITMNGKAKVNVYANNATITYSDIDNGVDVTIKSGVTGATVNASAGNVNSPVTIYGEINSTSTIVSPTGNAFGSNTTINVATGATMTFPNRLYIRNSSVFTSNGTVNIQDQLYMDGSGVVTFGTNSVSNINKLYYNSGSINVDCNSTTNVTNVNSFSGSAVRLLTPGCCAYFSLATPPSGSFNSNWLNSNGATAPNGIYYCGVAPYNSAASFNDLLSVASNPSGGYRVTFSSGTSLPPAGNEISITGVTGADALKLNGFWKVTLVSGNTYDLTGSVYFPSVNVSADKVYVNNLKFGTGVYKGETCPSTSCVVLPVTFLYFKARIENGNTQLKWASEKEEDNKLYIVQRSRNGVDYVDLNTKEGAGNSTSTLYYSDVDYNTPHGVSYYRIKMIDSKGGVTFSNIESVKNSGEDLFELYPNPNNGDFSISWGDTETEDQILIAVIDVTGNVVRNYETDFNANSISINSLPNGLYLVEIKTSTTKIVKKVIVGL